MSSTCPVLAPTRAAVHTWGSTRQPGQPLTLHSPWSPILRHAAADSDLQPYVYTGPPRNHHIKQACALARLPAVPWTPPKWPSEAPAPLQQRAHCTALGLRKSARGVGLRSWALHEGWRSGQLALLAQGPRTHVCSGLGIHATDICCLGLIRRNQMTSFHAP